MRTKKQSKPLVERRNPNNARREPPQRGDSTDRRDDATEEESEFPFWDPRSGLLGGLKCTFIGLAVIALVVLSFPE